MFIDHFDEMIDDLESELAELRDGKAPGVAAALERKIDELKRMRDVRRAQRRTPVLVAA